MRLILAGLVWASLVACSPGVSDLADAGVIADAAAPLDAGPTPDRPQARGTCPNFASGTNALDPNGRSRRIDLFLPQQLEDAPVLFIWHGLGGNPRQMAGAFAAQRVADRFGAFVVLPHSSGAFPRTEWAFSGDATLDVELFEETISCLDEQFGIDRARVYSTGFSAGALWSTWLLMHRSEYLAAATLFSGGTTSDAYTTPEFPLPVLAIHGGATDVFAGIVRFNDMTQTLAAELGDDGHTVVVCNHGRGHRITYDPSDFALPFLFAHRFGDTSSPFDPELPSEWPDECAVQ
jgi:poly(3-hydroxybutyrate) depolymerase